MTWCVGASSNTAPNFPPLASGTSAKKDDSLMAKEELLTIEGVVDEILPDGRFGVMLDNQCRIIAYTAGKMRRYQAKHLSAGYHRHDFHWVARSHGVGIE